MQSRPILGKALITIDEQTPYSRTTSIKVRYKALSKAIIEVDKIILMLKIKGSIGS
ncbi:TPA: hypothetical protein ACN983_004503 [Vibrio parahaemolyticus]